MIGCTIRLKKKRVSEWLGNLLGSNFFGSCSDHRELRKNEMNVFCIDCNLCFCKHCITNPSQHCFRYHRRLQICRYVYHDVVRLQDIQKYLECSYIQTYKINGEKAVHLNPRPQSGDVKASKSSKGGAYCEACGKHLKFLPNRFCSIACKVSLVAEMTKPEMVSYLVPDSGELSSWKENCDPECNLNESESTLSSTGSFEEIIQASWVNSMLKPKKKLNLHKRKGIPHRAPLR